MDAMYYLENRLPTKSSYKCYPVVNNSNGQREANVICKRQGVRKFDSEYVRLDKQNPSSDYILTKNGKAIGKNKVTGQAQLSYERGVPTKFLAYEKTRYH